MTATRQRLSKPKQYARIRTERQHPYLLRTCDAERMSSVDPVCSHLDTIAVTELPEEVPGCEDCLASGGDWMHLRICLVCGHVGCCDSSPNKHASAHAARTGHPLIRSLEPGEEWCWCFVDELGMLIPQVTGQTRIPPSPMFS